ncbi:hypothetical protein E2C01_088052 [Portunus trituberculatus]|uniref:Uncharacterized protein n=1 Tax=Portunus trituberculatus TaxID=210409 RepID=A0A5B7JDG5_PORTR|nr:hypothetical protein [Portunus trituberculatus]
MRVLGSEGSLKRNGSNPVHGPSEVTELRELKKVHPTLPILFIRVPLLPETFSDDLPESEQHDILCNLRVLPSPARPDPHPENPNHALTPSPRPHPQPAPLQLYRVLCDTLGKCWCVIWLY